jgi:hypothetical protein
MTEQKNDLVKFWETISSKVETVMASGKTPYAILDLDGTLVDHSIRTYTIFQDAIESPGIGDGVAQLVKSINPGEYDYYPERSFIKVGIKDESIIKQLLAFWDKYYFSNHYLKYDKQMPGAYDFIMNIRKLAINIIYLTSRDYENMGDGTRVWLYENEFLKAMDCTRTLMMKSDLKYKNYESKAENCERIKMLGQPILIIDNEPIDLQTIGGYFPEALPVLIDTPNSGKRGVLPIDILKLKDFIEVNSLFDRT